MRRLLCAAPLFPLTRRRLRRLNHCRLRRRLTMKPFRGLRSTGRTGSATASINGAGASSRSSPDFGRINPCYPDEAQPDAKRFTTSARGGAATSISRRQPCPARGHRERPYCSALQQTCARPLAVHGSLVRRRGRSPLRRKRKPHALAVHIEEVGATAAGKKRGRGKGSGVREKSVIMIEPLPFPPSPFPPSFNKGRR